MQIGRSEASVYKHQFLLPWAAISSAASVSLILLRNTEGKFSTGYSSNAAKCSLIVSNMEGAFPCQSRKVESMISNALL